MLWRTRRPPNNSQSGRGLVNDSGSADRIRAAGWGISAAGAFALLLLYSPLHPIIPSAGVFLTGIAILLWTSIDWSKNAATPEAAFNVMPAHLAALDAKGNVTLVNDAWRQFAVNNGFRGDGHGEGLNYIELCESATGECSEGAREVAAGIRRVLSGEQDTFSIEYPCHSPTEKRWFRCLVLRFPGERQGALVTHIDITGQVKMRAQLSELEVEQAGAVVELAASEKRQQRFRNEIADLKAALDEHAIVAICDTNGKITYVNDKYCEVSGFSREELIGSAAELDIGQECRETLAKGIPWKGEAKKTGRDGAEYWVAKTIMPFHDEQGQTMQFVLVGTDITSRKQAEESLVLRSEELARSNASLAEFAYLASHDLQEPLRGVNGCVQLLAKRYGDRLDGEAREWIRHAVLNTERMQSLISGLLDLSRIDRGPARVAARVDSGLLLANTVESIKSSIEESGARIEIAGPMPALRGDARQIGQVFQNLLANSIKFRSDEPPHITISASQPTPETVEFAVRDNGIGIDPRHAERIFGIFQRLHAQGRHPGAGIGLSIAKRIVERHGGQIWVATGVAHGAEIRFTLPTPEAAAQQPEPALAKGAATS